MHELSLRDEVFLLAHDDSGRLRVAEAGLGVGLAGATLIELLLHGRIAVVEGRLEVIDPVMSGRPEADDTVEAIRDNTAPCGPRAWVSWISHGAYGRAAEALESTGVITRTTTRLLGVVPVQRCVPKDLDDMVRVRSRVRFAVHGRDLPDESTAALCGLVRVLRLENGLLLSMPTSDLLIALERTTDANDVTVRQVTHAVEGVIASATYR